MPPDLPGALRFLFEHDDVARARRLQLHETVLPVDLDRAEDRPVERRRAIDVAHREGHMRQAVGLYHANPDSRLPNPVAITSYT